MSAPGTDVEFIRLWPCRFLEQDLPGVAEPNARLERLAAEQPDAGVFTLDDPAIGWLREHVVAGVDAYLRRERPRGAPSWGASARFLTRATGDYRPLAGEPGADVSGMYVVCWPADQDAGGTRDDGLPGCVSFYDPRAGMNMNAIKRDPYFGYHQSLRPRPGLLLLWPAHVRYIVHPNRSRSPAITVELSVRLRAGGEPG